MTDWRKVWKDKTRGGHEVLFIAQCPESKSWFGVTKEVRGLLSLTHLSENGYYYNTKTDPRDLIPIEPEVYEFECVWKGSHNEYVKDSCFYGCDETDFNFKKLHGQRTRVRVEVINE